MKTRQSLLIVFSVTVGGGGGESNQLLDTCDWCIPFPSTGARIISQQQKNELQSALPYDLAAALHSSILVTPKTSHFKVMKVDTTEWASPATKLSGGVGRRHSTYANHYVYLTTDHTDTNNQSKSNLRAIHSFWITLMGASNPPLFPTQYSRRGGE